MIKSDPTALGYPRYKDSAPEDSARDEGHLSGTSWRQEGLHTHTLWWGSGSLQAGGLAGITDLQGFSEHTALPELCCAWSIQTPSWLECSSLMRF